MASLDKPKCGATGKEMHETKEAAKGMVGAFGRARGTSKVYRCPFCDTYHLTHGKRSKRGRA